MMLDRIRDMAEKLAGHAWQIVFCGVVLWCVLNADKVYQYAQAVKLLK